MLEKFPPHWGGLSSGQCSPGFVCARREEPPSRTSYKVAQKTDPMPFGGWAGAKSIADWIIKRSAVQRFLLLSKFRAKALLRGDGQAQIHCNVGRPLTARPKGGATKTDDAIDHSGHSLGLRVGARSAGCSIGQWLPLMRLPLSLSVSLGVSMARK